MAEVTIADGTVVLLDTFQNPTSESTLTADSVLAGSTYAATGEFEYSTGGKFLPHRGWSGPTLKLGGDYEDGAQASAFTLTIDINFPSSAEEGGTVQLALDEWTSDGFDNGVQIWFYSDGLEVSARLDGEWASEEYYGRTSLLSVPSVLLFDGVTHRLTTIVGSDYVSVYVDGTLVFSKSWSTATLPILDGYTGAVFNYDDPGDGNPGGGGTYLSRLSIVAGAVVPTASYSAFWSELVGATETV